MSKSPPLGKRTWTQAEEEYLMEKWGTLSIPAIAKSLNRTENSIKIRASRLKLGPALMGGEYVTFNQLAKAVTGGSQSYTYQMTSWVKNRKFHIHMKKVGECSFRVVYLNEFWEWAEKNRSFIDFSKMEPLALGEEPDWVAEQRKKDFEAFSLQRKDPWTPEEDSRLMMLLGQHKYGYAELSEMLYRSAGAIQRRCTDLGLKDRPVKAKNTGKDVRWAEKDYETLADGIRSGVSYAVIGRTIGKSEKAIRGKVYSVYLTENQDKVRSMMGEYPWGYGAPEPTVKQGIYLPRIGTEVKKNLSILDAILRFRMNELGYDPYWQRFMCMKWNDIAGCAAGCSDCDSCSEFVRIKPQYCARCGATFHERAPNRFCGPCRTARKKAAQKKYMVSNKAAR